MAYTTINKSTDHFNTKLWTGNATDNRAGYGLKIGQIQILMQYLIQ